MRYEIKEWPMCKVYSFDLYHEHYSYGMGAKRYYRNSIRAIILDGKPWFVVADVTPVLDMSTTKAYELIPENEKTKKRFHDSGINRVMTKESGVYRLINGCDNSCVDVDKIREQFAKGIIPEMYKIIAENECEKRKLLEIESETQVETTTNTEMVSVTNLDDCITINNMAKELGVQPRMFMAFLTYEGFVKKDKLSRIGIGEQYKNKKSVVFDVYFTAGGDTINQVMFTQEGRAIVRDKWAKLYCC